MWRASAVQSWRFRGREESIHSHLFYILARPLILCHRAITNVSPSCSSAPQLSVCFSVLQILQKGDIIICSSSMIKVKPGNIVGIFSPQESSVGFKITAMIKSWDNICWRNCWLVHVRLIKKQTEATKPSNMQFILKAIKDHSHFAVDKGTGFFIVLVLLWWGTRHSR